MEGYKQLSEQVYVRETSLDELAKVDSLVLDIDGVILDVTGSFRVAISRTVQFFFNRFLGFNSGSAVLVSPEETQLFKLAGGFNNDWELTFAAVLFYLVIARVFKTCDFDSLKARGDLADFCQRIKRSGGGLDAAENLALEEALPELKGEILREWRTDLIQQVFQEYYAGVDFCQKLYGFEPVYIKEKGLMNQERVIMDSKKLTGFHQRLGVLTGRTKEETEAALEKAALSKLIPKHNVLFDDGIHRKPDPKMLEILGSKIGAKTGIYVGDTLDDLQTVVNFRNCFDQPKFLSGIVTRQASEIELYAEAGADIISLNTNDLLDTMIALRS